MTEKELKDLKEEPISKEFDDYFWNHFWELLA